MIRNRFIAVSLYLKVVISYKKLTVFALVYFNNLAALTKQGEEKIEI
ncbi:hypothetical protein [Colwellia piezophila]|nr:hypothetical protein [Colwellia piezophila]